MDGLECGGCLFYSNFDSANLYRIENITTVRQESTSTTFSGRSEIIDLEFNLWTKPDCGGTEFENGNRTWFNFGIKCPIPSALIKFNMVDLNKQAKLYSQGMGPVCKILPGKPHWERICDRPTYTSENNVFTLSFKIKTPENINCTTYLAFTYPYSYSELQHKLDLIDKRFKNDEEPVARDDIYYVRECVCNSLEFRRVDLITISSYHNITTDREPKLANLFPDRNVLRPFCFRDKKVIFISARVHPGETPSSFVFNGVLNLLLSRDDPVAILLRKNYVFKLIPCLNPDGVVKGHYRTDTRGVNLNRVYLNPIFEEHPSIYAARALIRYHHYGYEKEDNEMEDDSQRENSLSTEVSHMTIQDKNKNVMWCNKCKADTFAPAALSGIIENSPVLKSNNDSSVGQICINCGEPIEINDNILTQGDCAAAPESGLFLYVDMHGHASKKGIFMYGNHFDDVDNSVKCMLLPKIMSINNHNFHFTACNFTERNMYIKDKRDGMSKEGSGRVAVYKLTGLVQSYTLECNYNTGRLVNVLPPTIRETQRSPHTLIPPKYTPHIFEEVGKAIGYSILDLTSQNPFARLPHSEYHSLGGLREWLRLHCTNNLGETRKSPNKLKIRHSASLHAQGRAVRSIIVKTRSLSKYAPKKVNLKQLRTPKALKKEKKIITKEILSPQPSCSYMHQSPSTSSSRCKCVTSTRSLNMQPKGKTGNVNEKSRPNTNSGCVNHVAKNIQNAYNKSKFRTELPPSSKPKTREMKNEDIDKIKLKEICYVKDTDGKKVIARYENDGKCDDDNLIVAWGSNATKPQVFTHNSRIPSFLSTRPQTGEESKRAFRVHNFQKSNVPFTKAKRNKRVFKRLSSTDTNKIKKKLLKTKSNKELN